MASKNVYVPEIGNVLLTKRRTSKNIKLSYNSDGSIKVSLPMFVAYQSGVNFVKKNIDWLEKHKPEGPKLIEQDSRIGKAHRVNFTSSTQASRPSVRVTNTQINVTLPADTKVQSTKAQSAAMRGAHKALAKEAKQLLPQRLDKLAKENDFEYSSLKMKRLASRWGSCSQEKDIVLNIYLMQLPWELIDYVIIHELVHTEHMNHSSDFWNRLQDIKPQAKDLRKQLKNYRTMIEPTNY